MKRAWAELSRIEEVRGAARGWKSAGAIDEAALAAIEAAYPDSRIRVHGFWRVLVFVLVSVVVNALLLFFVRSSSALFAQFLVFGILLTAATEALRGSRYSGTGADAAASFWALSYLLLAVGDRLFRHQVANQNAAMTLMIAAIAAAGTLAAWRWGFWLYAACGAAAAYALIARLPFARVLWIVIAIPGIWLLRRGLDAARLAPDHRRCLAAGLAVSAGAVYACVNLFSVDHRIIELLQGYSPDRPRIESPPAGVWRVLAGIATALLPAIYMAWGIHARRRLLLGLGLAAIAVSAVTLVHYAAIEPIWMVLAVGGAILIAAAIAIQRALRSRPGGEWRGLTAEPLYEAERGGISPLAALAVRSVGGVAEGAADGVMGAAGPGAAPPPERHDVETGGGGYGGGGATGRY